MQHPQYSIENKNTNVISKNVNRNNFESSISKQVAQYKRKNINKKRNKLLAYQYAAKIEPTSKSLSVFTRGNEALWQSKKFTRTIWNKK